MQERAGVHLATAGLPDETRLATEKGGRRKET